MAEKLLDDAEIRASFQEVGGEGVAERMGTDPARQGHGPNATGDQLADRSVSQSTTVRIDEHRVRLRTGPGTLGEVRPERLCRPHPKG